MNKFAWVISVSLISGMFAANSSFGGEALKFVIDDDELILNGKSVTEVAITKLTNSICILTVILNVNSAEKFSRLTSENIGKPMQLILNDEQLSAPIILQQIIGRKLLIAARSCVEAEAIREAIQK